MSMTPQRTPLYAIDTQTAEPYVVVGWYDTRPLVAPMMRAGAPFALGPMLVERFVYSPRPQPLFPLVPAGDPAATAVLHR